MSESTPDLDRIDRKILQVLQADGRIANLKLAEAVALSPAAVLARVQRLTRAGYILGYEARLDPHKLGAGLLVFVEVLLDRTSPNVFDAFKDAVQVQLSAGVFLVAALSDWYDGWYARRHNAMSSFGRFFDPLADKVLISAAFFAFVFLDILSLWMVLVIVGRDVIVTILRVVADRKRQPVVTSRLAKWKTALQLVFLWYVIGAYTLRKVDWISARIDPRTIDLLFSPWIIQTSMLLLTALSLVTAAQYLFENRHTLRILTNGSLARTTP